eukprot:18056-Prymnesium_polylepis.2
MVHDAWPCSCTDKSMTRCVLPTPRREQKSSSCFFSRWSTIGDSNRTYVPEAPLRVTRVRPR